VTLPQSLFEPARQSIAAIFLSGHRLLEDRFAQRRFGADDPLRVRQFRLSPRSGS
jgi:hypothetical protein